MTLSPKKYASNFTSSTANRGVEARELEIANTRLDVQASSRSSAPGPPGPTQEPIEHDDTASYIQVEVRRGRLPVASSPAAPPASLVARSRPPHYTATAVEEAGRAMPQSEACQRRGAASPAGADGAGDADGAVGAGGADGADAAAAGDAARHTQGTLQTTVQKMFNKNSDYGAAVYDEFSGPERIEVYYFERGDGSYLRTSGGSLEGAVERAARVWGRRGRAALGEALAVPRALAAAAVAVGVEAERAALVTARGAVVGAVQTAADYALKPALALVFNAALQPVLVLAGNVTRALRAALQPLWGALGDALEPAARLLASLRLVNVHIHTHCTCRDRDHATAPTHLV